MAPFSDDESISKVTFKVNTLHTIIVNKEKMFIYLTVYYIFQELIRDHNPMSHYDQIP